MKPLRDPEGAELAHLSAVCDLKSRRVLEIGCGDGAFTRQYARMTRFVVGIDPEDSQLGIANLKNRSKKTHFLQAKGEQLPFPAQRFDIIIFASSL